MDSEIESLQRRLLKDMKPGDGSTFMQLGEWMIEIGKLNLEIASRALDERKAAIKGMVEEAQRLNLP